MPYFLIHWIHRKYDALIVPCFDQATASRRPSLADRSASTPSRRGAVTRRRNRATAPSKAANLLHLGDFFLEPTQSLGVCELQTQTDLESLGSQKIPAQSILFSIFVPKRRLPHAYFSSEHGSSWACTSRRASTSALSLGRATARFICTKSAKEITVARALGRATTRARG